MKNSIQRTVFIYFLLVMLFSSFLFIAFAYIISIRIVAEKVRHSFEENTAYVHNSLQNEVAYINRMMNFFLVNADVKKMISSETTNPYEFLQAAEKIETTIRSNLLINFFDYVNEIKVFNTTKELYTFNDDSQRTYLDGQAIIASSDFERIFNNNGKILFTAGKRNLLRQDLQNELLPPIIIFRVIKDSLYKTNIGFVAVYLNTEIFSRHLETHNFIEGSDFVLLDDNQLVIAGSPRQLTADLTDNLRKPSATDLVYRYKIGETGWSVSGILPLRSVFQDNILIVYLGIASIILSILVFLFLWQKLSARILLPLNLVSDSLKTLSQGQMPPVHAPSKSPEEIIRLTGNYNFMVTRLDELIKENIRKETARKEAEYKALQAQINPHFLYNTLSSIRWMAIIHHADNIKAVTETLVRLLRTTTKTSDEQSTLRHELENIKDYVFIQQLASRFNFTVEYEIPEELLDVPCIKFILQPLVENAIFHGLGKKQDSGYIKVSAVKKELKEKPVAEISVFDNGDGIAPEIIAKKQFTGIGIQNVSERLTLSYGNDYAPVIHSAKYEYTEVIIHIPLERNTDATE